MRLYDVQVNLSKEQPLLSALGVEPDGVASLTWLGVQRKQSSCSFAVPGSFYFLWRPLRWARDNQEGELSYAS